MEDSEVYQKRDQLLGEIYSEVKGMKEWRLQHDAKDDLRFEKVNNKIFWGAVSILVVAAATGVIPQLASFALEHFK